MILFFAKGKCDSDKFVRYCYSHYRNIMTSLGNELPETVEIIREEGAKPRFDTEDAHFNLSHSHGVMLVGISYAPIGVDVEKVRPIDFKKFDFIDAEDEQDFFEKWTERESYLKFTGEGLNGFRKEIPADAHFEHFDVFDSYHACICAEPQSIRAYELDINAIE
ncbi:MAG: hypothetical protein II867_02425 [Clostridia bacterium]|nr:hypothetical protein [Clostridia bacterium]